MRRIETEGGTLVGKVDRAAQPPRVVWSLECGECGTPVPLDVDTFQGKRPPVCDCGWKPEPYGYDLDRRPQWFDFSAAFETVPAAQAVRA